MKKNFRITTLILTLLGLVFCIGATSPRADAKINKITAMLDSLLTQADGREQFCKEYHKLTGIELELNQPVHKQYNEKLLITLASNDIPDVIEIQPEHTDVYLKLIEEGGLVPLDKFLKKSKVFKTIDKKFTDALQVNGKIYAVPLNSGGGCVTYIRKDWLDNLGLKAPTTWNEFYNVLKAFTFNDPDKNGKNDTYGTALNNVTDSIFLGDFLMGSRQDFYKYHGKWIDGFTQSSFKAGLDRLAKAYQAGVIEPDVFTNTTSSCQEKFYSGKVGVYHSWAGKQAAAQAETLLQKCGPKAKVIALPAVKGSHYWNRLGPMLAITKNAKDPEAIFKNYFEFMNDGGKGEMLFIHGVKDVHYKVENGKYMKLPRLSNPNVTFTRTCVNWDVPLHKWNDPIPMPEASVESLEAFKPSAMQLYLLPPAKTYLKYATDIATLKETLIAKTMMGEYTADAAIKAYKEKAAKYEIPKILQELNKK